MNKTELISYFDTIGFHPSHRMGQNFLVDGNLARKLVALSGIGESDRVFEVGPGMGMISREILKSGASLIALEKDKRLFEYLRKTLVPEFDDRCLVLEGDAVDLPLGGSGNVDELSVVANPPFAITGPWIAGIVDQGLPKTLALLLQKEAVDRLTATAGMKQFGPLSIRLEAAYQVSSTYPVPPASFFPPPQITSRIVVFHRKEEPFVFKHSMQLIMNQLFQQRRKQIGGRLKKRIEPRVFETWKSILLQNQLSLQSRPEQIPTEIWMKLSVSL